MMALAGSAPGEAVGADVSATDAVQQAPAVAQLESL